VLPDPHLSAVVEAAHGLYAAVLTSTAREGTRALLVALAPELAKTGGKPHADRGAALLGVRHAVTVSAKWAALQRDELFLAAALASAPIATPADCLIAAGLIPEPPTPAPDLPSSALASARHAALFAAEGRHRDAARAAIVSALVAYDGDPTEAVGLLAAMHAFYKERRLVAL
jgi:hypothetical protein